MTAAGAEHPSSVITESVLREVNDEHGLDLSLVRRLGGGHQSGAWLVGSADLQAVLKWSPDEQWAAQVMRAERSVRVARSHGYPTPRWLATGVTVAGHGYQLQEVAPGRPPVHLDAGAAAWMVTVLERQRDLDPDPGRCWSDHVTATAPATRDALARIATSSPTGTSGRPTCCSTGPVRSSP